MYYFDILQAFHSRDIKYLIVGGLAVNLHGVPRVTQDLDIIIALDENNVKKLNDALDELGFEPRQPVNPLGLANKDIREDWITKKNLKAFSYYHKENNYMVVDVVLVYHGEFQDLWNEKISLPAKGMEISIISLSNLIKMKRESGRKQDLSDVEMLCKVLDLQECNHD